MDAREMAAETSDWYESFDQDNMTLTVILPDEDDDWEEEEVTFPAKFEVCSLCDGKGKHVNPSIDSQGIPAHELMADPEFAESYFGGVFDVTCYQCKGRRVEPDVDQKALDDEGKRNYKRLEEKAYDDACFAREQAMERRMGC